MAKFGSVVRCLALNSPTRRMFQGLWPKSLGFAEGSPTKHEKTNSLNRFASQSVLVNSPFGKMNFILLPIGFPWISYGAMGHLHCLTCFSGHSLLLGEQNHEQIRRSGWQLQMCSGPVANYPPLATALYLYGGVHNNMHFNRILVFLPYKTSINGVPP